jgi:hypothetical protein
LAIGDRRDPLIMATARHQDHQHFRPDHGPGVLHGPFFNPRAYSVRCRGQSDLEIKILVGFNISIRHTRNRDRVAVGNLTAWGMLSMNSP